MRLIRLLMPALVLITHVAGAQGAPWSISPEPSLVLGDATGDKAVLFGAGLVGATRLPDGRILVADRGDFSFKLFDATGKFMKYLGRQGHGPGEFTYLARLWRCGDRILAYDIEGYLTSVFSLDLEFQRSFQFKGPPGNSTPYSSACNAAGRFVHIGWEDRAAMKASMFRSNVPLWTSGMDTTVHVIGEVLGSERWGNEVGGRLRGTRPMPLGKQPVIAIDGDRIYRGTADSWEITITDFEGRPTGAIRRSVAPVPVTRADIDAAMQREAAGQSEQRQASVREEYARMQFPKTLPAYTALLFDAAGLLWVRDYPRGSPTSVKWSVFDRTGKQAATVEMPANLEVSEIGTDYVLGKFIDPDEEIPQIRMYRLRR